MSEDTPRSCEEIRRVFDLLGDDPTLREFRADDFQTGYFIGKVVALGWVLGEPSSVDMSNHYTLEEFMRQMRWTIDGLSDALKNDPDPTQP